MTGALDPVIHQEVRLQILALLYRNRQASFTSLRDGLDLTAGNLASHVGRLVDAGYVRSHRALAGVNFEVRYTITPQGDDAFAAYVADLKAVLALQ